MGIFPAEAAKCAVAITYLTPGDVDHATSRNLKEAAEFLVNECVVKRGSGGIMRSLGENKKLLVTVSEYKPTVTCTNPSTRNPDAESCQWILERLPVGARPISFGRKGLPRKAGLFELPMTIASRKYRLRHVDSLDFIHRRLADRKCIMALVFNTREPGDKTIVGTWNMVFDAAVAIVAKCASSGLPGEVRLNSSMIVKRQLCVCLD